MEQLNSRKLKNSAAASIEKAGFDPRKLVLFHTAVALALSLVALAIDFALELQIGNTGGLSGVGMRSVLETVQAVLNAMAEGMGSEIPETKDEGPVDVTLEEMNKKKAKDGSLT